MIKRWLLALVVTLVPLTAAPMAAAQAPTTAPAPASSRVSVSPDVSELPGGSQLQQMVNATAAFALIVWVGAVVGGAVVWAFGSAQANYQQIGGGKRTVVLAVIGSVIVGGAAALVNFFTALGGQIR